MAQKVINVWFDQEGDFLEVPFERRAGLFRETANSQVMEKVDKDGNVIGFSIASVSKLASKPLEVALS
jgi:uncharacterized protein YuzE